MNYYKLAQHIRNEILKKVGIPVSIGVSRTKTLAKLASDKSKNIVSHVCIVGKQSISKFLKETEVDEIWGIGRRLAPKLKGHGIYTAFDYVSKNDIWLKARFGKNGLQVKYELLGNLVSKITNERSVPKSISDTKSFPIFTSDYNYLKNELMTHIHASCRKLRKADCKCSTIGLILKTKDFRVFCSKVDLEIPTDFEFEVSKYAFAELDKLYDSKILYRSIGILLENFNSCENSQLQLFGDDKKQKKNDNLVKSLDKLEEKFGRNIVKTGFTTDVDYKQDFLTR